MRILICRRTKSTKNMPWSRPSLILRTFIKVRSAVDLKKKKPAWCTAKSRVSRSTTLSFWVERSQVSVQSLLSSKSGCSTKPQFSSASSYPTNSQRKPASSASMALCRCLSSKSFLNSLAVRSAGMSVGSGTTASNRASTGSLGVVSCRRQSHVF